MKTNEQILKDKVSGFEINLNSDDFKLMVSIMDEAVKINKEQMVEDIDYQMSYMLDIKEFFDYEENSVKAFPQEEINGFIQQLKSNM